MDSLNATFLLAGEPYRVYVNTRMSPIAGTRLHPLHAPQLVSFIVAGHGTLHTYNEDDDRVLRSLNAVFFQEGILQEEKKQASTRSSKRQRTTVKEDTDG